MTLSKTARSLVNCTTTELVQIQFERSGERSEERSWKRSGENKRNRTKKKKKLNLAQTCAYSSVGAFSRNLRFESAVNQPNRFTLSWFVFGLDICRRNSNNSSTPCATLDRKALSVSRMSYKALFFLVSVFFTASYAEISLVNFTDCTLTEYLCDTRKCMTQFVKNVQNDPKGDCG